MSMMIPIEELIQDKCYEVESADYKALVEVDIINGEYCGRNYKTPIKAIDAIPRQQIDKLLRIFEGIAACDASCSAEYVVKMIHNYTDEESFNGCKRAD